VRWVLAYAQPLHHDTQALDFSLEAAEHPLCFREVAVQGMGLLPQGDDLVVQCAACAVPGCGTLHQCAAPSWTHSQQQRSHQECLDAARKTSGRNCTRPPRGLPSPDDRKAKHQNERSHNTIEPAHIRHGPSTTTTHLKLRLVDAELQRPEVGENVRFARRERLRATPQSAEVAPSEKRRGNGDVLPIAHLRRGVRTFHAAKVAAIQRPARNGGSETMSCAGTAYSGAAARSLDTTAQSCPATTT